MGEAKRKKARLGEYYGQPIAPGHPDYVAPTQSEQPQPKQQVVVGRGRSTMVLLSLMAGLAIPTGRR